VEETKKSIEVIVSEAETAFQKQLASLMEDKMTDIAADIKVYKNSLVEDGYIDADKTVTTNKTRL
jgi:hypothetical protein